MFLTALYAQGVENVRFSENLACFIFLSLPFWDSPFCPITDELIKVKVTDVILLFKVKPEKISHIVLVIPLYVYVCKIYLMSV